MSSELSLFHPLIARWFTERVGTPTDVQTQAWPLIARGEHVLITAPTGSGKTLTAFLWALDRLVRGEWPLGHTSVLYVSPLKALNNDVRRNLLRPLSELREVFAEAEEPFPDIGVLTRSGDTPQSDRRRMLRHPPEILITTPESLNLLLSSQGGRSLLTGVETSILDEIHAVVGNRRGVHLITAVERLVRLSGEFQRIALSATVRPLEKVAEFIGGLQVTGAGPEPRYSPRAVATVRSTDAKRYEIQVRFPPEAAIPEDRDTVWPPLVEACGHIIDGNRSTLLFTNARRLCEKLTRFINGTHDYPVAYAHHGSLSREIREEVEQKLKDGDLKAIVATNSLELGIDIGALDEVILVQSPPSIASAIQRIGRAGHRVGEISRGTLFPTHSQDFLEAAVLAAGVLSQDIEEVHPVEAPLDVLSQIIVSMVGMETWNADELFVAIRCSYPYRDLGREHFDLVLEMLAGRYAHSRIRDLRPKISIDRLDNTVVARKGALQDLYFSGGTIPDRGYFNLRTQDTNARIGELDEEFVWERSLGQTFTLGTQNWTIQRITHNDVIVTPASPKSAEIPFWKAEGGARDFHFSERIGLLLEEAEEELTHGPDGFTSRLRQQHAMDAVAAQQLTAYLLRQREMTDCSLPHRHHLLVEFVSSGPGGLPGNQVILHTFWGGRVNRPYAMALEAAWDDRFGQQLELYPADDCIVLMLPHEVEAEEILSLVASADVQPLVEKRLESAGVFGARFRECAGRALLLSRTHMGKRMPLWVSRLRSQKLLDAVRRYEDFPILLETWRSCLQDEFDLEALHRVLAEMESGAIAWSQVRSSHPSPFAQGIAWRQIDKYMYMSDEPGGATGSSELRRDLIRDVVFTPGLRPGVPADVASRFEEKRQRLFAGYAPVTGRDLVDWVVERLAIPEPEFAELMDAVRRDGEADPSELLSETGQPRLVRLSLPSLSQSPLVIALERVPEVARALFPEPADIKVEALSSSEAVVVPDHLQAIEEDDDDPEPLVPFLSEWLRFYGPVTADEISRRLGLPAARLQTCLDDLVDAETIVAGHLVAESEDSYYCDSENLEMLLRLARALAIPIFEPLPLYRLPLFLATWQGLTRPEEEMDGLARRLEQLLCYEAPASLWESDILPARLSGYTSSWLDTCMQESPLRWVGRGRERIAFCFEPDLDLLEGAPDNAAADAESGQAAGEPLAAAGDEMVGVGEGRSTRSEEPGVEALFPDAAGRYDFSTLLRLTGLGAAELSDRLWRGVWQGQVTNDSFSSLRRGVENQFSVPRTLALDRTAGSPGGLRRAGVGRGTGVGRSSFARWKGSLPYAGNWHMLAPLAPSDDLLAAEERKKDRVRLLLDRYGLLFRELLQREAAPFRWAVLFRSLRLMELSGEVLAGCFFHGIPGPQFIAHRAFRLLQRQLPEDAVYWVGAADPASVCGLQLDDLRGEMPRRVPSTHLVYHGSRLVLISSRNGKSLSFRVAADDPDIQRYFGLLHHLLSRPFQAVRQLGVETINDDRAAGSPYADALRTAFEARTDHAALILFRKSS
jgi:ATP-dependent Lhr-like helicase